MFLLVCIGILTKLKRQAIPGFFVLLILNSLEGKSSLGSSFSTFWRYFGSCGGVEVVGEAGNITCT
jgi:hypothetical protein